MKISTSKDLSVVLNTDGFRVYNFSRNEPWPIILTINELQFPENFNLRNVIILGFYSGKQKPSFEKILPLCLEEQTDIFTTGYLHGNDLHKIYLIQNSCDKPARSAILEHTGHRSNSGCIFCYVPQESKIVDNKRHFYFPISDCNDLLRVDIGWRAAAHSADETGFAEYGVKKSSYLLNLPYFLPVTGSIIDQLHCIGGVALKLLSLIKKVYPHEFEALDRKILALKPPNCFAQKIRSFVDLKSFQGHELRFLFLYCLPVLSSNLSVRIQKIVRNLSSLIYYSNCQTFNETTLNLISISVESFIAYFIEEFGIHNITINVHELVHLSDNVRYNGFGFANSCYGFEIINRLLGNMVHGTIDPAAEIMRRFNDFVEPILNLDSFARSNEMLKFARNILEKKKYKISFVLSPDLSVIGSLKNSEFDRCYFKGKFLCTTKYDLPLKFCSSYIYLKREKKLIRMDKFSVNGTQDLIISGMANEARNVFNNFFTIDSTNIECIFALSCDFETAFKIDENNFCLLVNEFEFY